MGFISTLRQPIDGFLYIIGALLSIAAVSFLVSRVIRQKKIRHIISFAIYGFSLIAMYTISALYHSLPISQEATDILRQLDHAMIYFLIVGSCTPIFLIVLRGGWRWSLLAVNWGLASGGIALRLIFRYPPRPAIVAFFIFYLLMGWMLVIAWRPLVRAIPKRGMFWLFGGGLFYTIGAGILNVAGLDLGNGWGGQQVWPLFVMAGSFCQFWLMLKYIRHFE
jgi:hemolysin III